MKMALFVFLTMITCNTYAKDCLDYMSTLTKKCTKEESIKAFDDYADALFKFRGIDKSKISPEKYQKMKEDLSWSMAND